MAQLKTLSKHKIKVNITIKLISIRNMCNTLIDEIQDKSIAVYIIPPIEIMCKLLILITNVRMMFIV